MSFISGHLCHLMIEHNQNFATECSDVFVVIWLFSGD